MGGSAGIVHVVIVAVRGGKHVGVVLGLAPSPAQTVRAAPVRGGV